MQSSRRLLLYTLKLLLLTLPTVGLAQQMRQLKPNELPLNLPGATTIAAPPRSFDPIAASDQDLAEFGFPPRPNEIESPKAFATWKSAMAASKQRITPVLAATNIFHGPAKMKAGASAPKTGADTSYSSNWSGYVNASGASNYSASSFYFLVSDYEVPLARQAFGACTGGWDYSSAWVGIDGWGSPDVLQAGTESDAYCGFLGITSTYYAPWFEWYPYGETRITNLPIAPGDDYFVEVWSTSSTQGHAYLVNRNAGQYVIVNFSAPAGTTLRGNSAEFVEERPGVGGGLATLTNYISDPFWGSYAYNFNYAAVDPSSSSSFPVIMLDNASNPISYPVLLGPSAFVMHDEGSAY